MVRSPRNEPFFEVYMNVMKFAIPALLAFSATFAQQGAPTGAAADPTAEEQKALDALKGKLEGAIVWATSRANSHHDIWMMNADGSNPHALTSGDNVD